MFGVNRPKSRFSLILLEEGEYYFDDFSAFYYPPARDDEDSFRKRVKGRLLLCSASLMFDPEDIRLPVSKFPYRDCSSIEHWNDVTSPLPSKADIFSVKTSLVVEMKENNTNAPYKFVKSPVEYRFSLNYVTLSSLLSRTSIFMSISRLPRLQMESMIKSIIEERERSAQFDNTWLVDISEHQLIELTGARITPLVVNPGRVLITNSRLYFQPINNIEAAPVNIWKLESITRVSKRRHALREIGIELFFDDERSVFFTFQSPKDRNRVTDLLTSHPGLAKLQTNTQSNMALKWQNGIISNFEYLMHLNYSAGRTFNDLTQYPVFPWVVLDFSSSTLDLNNPATFRDLSKPIGALNPQRLATFQERYHEIPEGQPKFLYGTHYSTPAYVLYYLVRQAPEYMLRLQNGRFDAPDRMFHSIEETCNSVLNNPTDVKELIPEFYQPEKSDFLLNTEGLDLGAKQNGVRLGDVVLPPWATDTKDCIRQLRAALESDYVSENLHNWIDLIFGYKQTGPKAIEANNVFYHLTYEGAVDIEQITDLLERESLEAQINEFGQTPKQLFDFPHPQKVPKYLRTKSPAFGADNMEADITSPYKPPSRSTTPTSAYLPAHPTSSIPPPTSTSPININIKDDMNFNFASMNLSASSSSPIPFIDLSTPTSHSQFNSPISTATSFISPTSHPPSGGSPTPPRAAGVVATWGNVTNIELDFSIKLHRDAVTSVCLSRNLDTMYSVSQDTSLKIYSLSEKKQLRSVNLCGLALSACQLAPEEKSIIIGSWDNNIYVYSVDYGRVSETIAAHDDAVSCLCMRGDNLLSGSWDSTVKLWKIRQTGVNKVPAAEFTDSETEIRCVDLDPSGNIAVAGADDGSIVFSDLRSQTHISTMQPHADAVTQVKFAPDGKRVITCSEDQHIKVLEVRGAEIVCMDAHEPIRALDTDGQTMFVGGESGIVRMWDIRSALESHLDVVKADEPLSYITMAAQGDVMVSATVEGHISIWKTSKS
jgi:factor associated with neutral sphingomyelinase activation